MFDRQFVFTVVVVVSQLATAAAADAPHRCPLTDPALAAVELEQPGEGAFGAIAEIVAALEADPKTDWATVDIDALRAHLVDMSELVLHAESVSRRIDRGVELTVTGTGRTVAALRRMVPAHAAMMARSRGYQVAVEEVDDGVRLRVQAGDEAEVRKLRALGLFGFMSLGHHHGPHHLAMARGADPHRHP